MSSALRQWWGRTGALALVSVLTLPAPARGQAPVDGRPSSAAAPGSLFGPDTWDRLEAAYEAADSRWRWAATRADGIATSRRSEIEAGLSVPLDSVVIGPHRVLGRTDDLAELAPALEASWEAFRSRVGLDRSAVRGTDRRVLVRGNEDPVRQVVGTGVAALLPGPIDPTIHADAVRRQLPLSLGGWLPPAALTEPAPWSETRAALFRHISPRAPDCLKGADEICLALLGLTPARLDADYSRGRPYRLALDATGEAGDLLLPRDVFGTRASGRDTCSLRFQGRTLCLSDLRDYGVYRTGVLQPTGAVRTFVEVVLARGGDGALDRALALPAGTSLREALETTAGAPLPDLITAWRSRMQATPVPAREGSGSTSALLWLSAFGLLGLTSTRWRFP